MPRTLAPIGAVRLSGGGRPQDSARAFLARYGSDLGSADLRDLGSFEESTGPDGTKRVQFSHVIPGTEIAVFERGTGFQVDANENVSFVETGFGLDFSGTATSPSISEATAKNAASGTVRARCGDAGSASAPVLGGYPDEAGAVHLAYRVELEAAGTCGSPIVYVNALSGETLHFRDESPAYLDTVRGGSSYYWNDASDRKTLDVSQGADFAWYLRTMGAQAPVETRDSRTGAVVTSPLGTWDVLDRGVSVDAHFHATRALEYYREVHGRRGLDGRGGVLRVYVHDNSSWNTDGDNAKYNTREASVHLGDGNPRTQKHLPFALSFDVMVHEIGHGIVAHTSRLVYEREAGALNESFADVMSIAAKMWAPETRETATFRYAERSVNESVYGRPYLRDVLSPTPGFDGIWSYTQMEPCDSPDRKGNDACSVHAVAGIGNRAFAMMAVGGEETARTGTRIAVPSAIGYSAAAYVWYQSITTLANPRATYRDAALAQLKVAERIGPAARNAVGCAWAAVDVLSPVEQALWSLVCTSQTRVPKTGTCSDIGNGVMCHRSTAFAAVECRNGSTAAGQNCVSPRSRCVQVSPTDFRARLDTNGRAVCK